MDDVLAPAVPADEPSYEALFAAGYEYGPAFQGLTSSWRAGGDVYAAVSLPEGVDVEGYVLHPALADAALHAMADQMVGEVRLPFSLSGVQVWASGARRVRVRVSPVEGGHRVQLADVQGRPVAEIDRIVTRPARLPAAPVEVRDVYAVQWVPLPSVSGPVDVGWVESDGGDLPVAPMVVVPVRSAGGDVVAETHRLVREVLDLVQRWLSRDDESRLVVVVSAGDLAAAGARGLIRSAQTEHPGRFVLVETDGQWQEQLPAVMASGEPEVSIRDGAVLVPRVDRAAESLSVPDGDWELRAGGDGTFTDVRLAACEVSSLEPSQVRVDLHTIGLNFRDVAVALGMVEGGGLLGCEGAGVVAEVGSAVRGLRPGDRVMGLFSAVGPSVVTDQRLLVRVPEGWSWAQAATTTAVFLTAYWTLVRGAAGRAGETLLVHAGTGGVGMAAVQLAGHLGMRVLATAGPAKWPVLRDMGLSDEQIASSRTVDFEEKFRRGGGVDVVLNSLTGDFIDASLRLLKPGGRFVEIGKTDVRDPQLVEAAYEGVSYAFFDMLSLDPDEVASGLAELMPLFAAGVLRPLPVTVRAVGEVREVLRFMSQARHVGKLALRLPQPWSAGPVLVTGGTGMLGGLVAERLVRVHGVRDLVLVSRQGPDAAGADELRQRLGVGVRVEACDVTDAVAVAELVGRVRPRAVIHTAGTLADSPVLGMSSGQVDAVLAPKVDGTWVLHEALPDVDAFVVFSSAAGVLGSNGQGNYAAANVFMDELMALRRSQGLTGVSLAWGYWADDSGLTAHLSDVDRARITNQGLVPMSAEVALGLFDAALNASLADPLLVLTPWDAGVLRQRVREDRLPGVLRSLVKVPVRRMVAQGGEQSLEQRLAGMPVAAQRETLTSLVLTHTAAVLGHGGTDGVDAAKPFKDLGFDSLTAVELRNRLNAATGRKLPATLVFDHPTPNHIATYLQKNLTGDQTISAGTLLIDLERLADALGEFPLDTEARRQIGDRLWHLSRQFERHRPAASTTDTVDLKAATTDDELFEALDMELGEKGQPR
ncbi:NADPH:quinone reductase-like Zn-dependent oxidoreductase/acyl carrier protein [Actinoplanes couchii]|nr:SDR family NAD(P)-dependent oxidoreductase [Actinoplanes couchii]MDR6315982.1 NADPH:quinone reductase-like Zn-dependent oxidoreductase/acyl carrier protein [Actinoplanes couchii]